MLTLAAVLCILATAVLTLPGRRLSASPTVGTQRVRSRRLRPRPGQRRRPRERTPVGTVLVEVAARLRTGASVRSAWLETCERHDDVPAPLRELAGLPTSGAEARLGGVIRRGEARSPGPREDAVAGAVAAVRLAERLGAPLADVLESCAQGVAEAEEAAVNRRTALAAPRATARLLGWLPLTGVLLGVVLGVDPVGVLLDGSWGTVSLVLGLALMVAGHRWTGVLVAAAERAGR